MNILIIDSNFNSKELTEELKKLYKMYLEVCEKRTIFQKIVPLRFKNLALYLEKCRELTQGVKFISFRKDKQLFEVRMYSGGKRRNLGSYKSFDDACEAIQEWFKLQN